MVDPGSSGRHFQLYLFWSNCRIYTLALFHRLANMNTIQQVCHKITPFQVWSLNWTVSRASRLGASLKHTRTEIIIFLGLRERIQSRPLEFLILAVWNQHIALRGPFIGEFCSPRSQIASGNERVGSHCWSHVIGEPPRNLLSCCAMWLTNL